MSGPVLALLLFAAMIGLIVARMHVGVAMFVTGALGFGILTSSNALFNLLNNMVWSRVSHYSLTVIPLFVLMGQVALHGGFGKSLFNGIRSWVGHRPGGLAIASIIGCGAFGAISGSSVATGATMGSVALPEMRRYGYSGVLSTGSLAAGGTLGILIPPSVILVIYAILTEQSIGALFLAALVPGILAVIGYVITVRIFVAVDPESAPLAPRVGWASRLRVVNDVWPVVLIFLAVIGGIYLGVFTPTEAGAIGVFLVAVAAFMRGEMDGSRLVASLLETARTTAMIFLILIAAELYGSFITVSGLTRMFTEALGDAQISPYLVLLAILLFYLVGGCVMDSLSMILITIPVFYPVLSTLDFGLSPDGFAIWFGILALTLVEMGLITPPVGLNAYVINSLARDIPITQTFRGVVPFLASDIVRVALIILFPALALWWM
ncbi:TRAP transporter large permease [Chelativorans sp. AA-79]|uniref:TRAP transporter large permease n=1 Tax=Chelativorans sp. AA-79 TaxID=3028735 RepID=UPI0023F99AFD|nr:TRAP transporter large permease [Chelativorans sp. AA-79]WEX09685.1 TRAP transporter large permease [Chelativorans sp. AA-79]